MISVHEEERADKLAALAKKKVCKQLKRFEDRHGDLQSIIAVA